MIFKRKVAFGELPLTDVAMPALGDTLLVLTDECEGTGRVVELRDGRLGAAMNAWVPDVPVFGATYLDQQVRVRWKEKGGRRLLEAKANVIDPAQTDGLLWLADLGRWNRQDRRVYVRVPIEAPGHLELVGTQELLPCTTVNISENSLEADLEEIYPLERGATIRLRCLLDETPFVFYGEVLSTREQRVVLHFPKLLDTTRDDLRAKVMAASARKAA